MSYSIRTAHFVNGGKGRLPMLVIVEAGQHYGDGARYDVADKRAARKLAQDMNAKPWNF
jgi:hypothetical protein